MNDFVNLQPGESIQSFIDRMIEGKRSRAYDLTWEQLAKHIAANTGIYRSESTWRKYQKNIEYGFCEDINELILAYKKEKVKNSDERVANNAIIRRIAREETIKEIAENCAKIISDKKQLLPEKPSNLVDGPIYNEGILQLSDWHYGMEINNFWNTFNPEICRERVRFLINDVITNCYTFGIRKLYVANLGDMISGRIHNTLRWQSRNDVISQIMEVSEILAEFLTELANEGIEIHYYDCLDNHSRLEPIKTESLDLESLARITPWYLRVRLKDYKNIHVYENAIDEDIITFNVLDGKYTIGAVHGHRDKAQKVVSSLTCATKIDFDMILTAHYHHFSGDEQNEVIVLSNSSLMGTDNYSKNGRLTAKPSQNFIVVNENSVCDYIHRIVL